MTDRSIHVHPVIQVLSDEAILRVHASSLKILSEIGIRVDSDQALRIFKNSPGVTLLDEKHIAIQPDLVEWAIESAPPVIDIYNRIGEVVMHLGNDSTRFGIGVTNLFYQDPTNQQILPFCRNHMRQSVGLGNLLPAYDVISTIGILRDLAAEKADLIAILEMVANTTKPLILLISDEKQFLPGLVLLEQLIGDLALKPSIIPYFNPVSPLILNHSTADNMLTAIRRGLPIIFSNYGMAGVSTPITSAGTLAQLNAELLGGLVYSQLIKPGTPVILGSLPAFFDMKSMVDFFDPQTMLLNLACAEMMNHYHLPHAGTSGSTNGWGADLLGSEALSMNQITSCLGKVGIAPFIGGTHGSKVFSPEVVVYTNELIEQSRHFQNGFIINEETLALEELKKTRAGGNFISSRQTMKYFREAYHSSSIFPRLSLEKWQEIGQPDAQKILRERTLDLLSNPTFPDNQQELLAKGEKLISNHRLVLK
jgi:trimethylamine---corrinoid protein Co-methyltransferase